MHSAVDIHGAIQDPSLALVSNGVVADLLSTPLMRTAKTGGAKMGFGSEYNSTHMHSAVDTHGLPSSSCTKGSPQSQDSPQSQESD